MHLKKYDREQAGEMSEQVSKTFAQSEAHLWDGMTERTQVITFEYNRQNANEHLMMNDELRTQESLCKRF